MVRTEIDELEILLPLVEYERDDRREGSVAAADVVDGMEGFVRRWNFFSFCSNPRTRFEG